MAIPEKLEWQERVLAERQELAQNLTRLELFIDTSEKFAALPKPDRLLMEVQRDIMKAYLICLDARIERW